MRSSKDGTEMVRKQVYITEDQQKALRRLAVHTRRKQSELIRQAINQFLTEARDEDRHRLRQGRSLWRDRDDLPGPAALRREVDLAC
ncbi:MAG: ribbon-helix-helix domain-containing protein [Candidatus Latescibacterota bacterium]|jgi:hypothetical protein